MEVNHEISKTLFALIDDLWVYAAPLLLAYLMRDFTANIVAYCRLRWSKMDYNSEWGAQVLLDGKYQRLMKLSINVVAFYYRNEEGKKVITTMSTREYWKMKKTFVSKED